MKHKVVVYHFGWVGMKPTKDFVWEKSFRWLWLARYYAWIVNISPNLSVTGFFFAYVNP